MLKTRLQKQCDCMSKKPSFLIKHLPVCYCNGETLNTFFSSWTLVVVFISSHEQLKHFMIYRHIRVLTGLLSLLHWSSHNHSLNLLHVYLFYYCCYIVFCSNSVLEQHCLSVESQTTHVQYFNLLQWLWPITWNLNLTYFEDSDLPAHQKWSFMLKILKCYRLDRKETYRCYYNEPVVFNSKISVGKMTEEKNQPTDLINFCCFQKTRYFSV